jgi:hypothetical protein
VTERARGDVLLPHPLGAAPRVLYILERRQQC